MELLREGAIDEYYLYLFAKTTNDFRLGSETSPRNLWQQVDFGELSFAYYTKVKAAIQSMFESRGIDKVLLLEHKTIQENEPYLYVVKYGDEITNRRTLLPLDIDDFSEFGPDVSQLAVVISRDTNITPSFFVDPILSNIQAGITVPNEAPTEAPIANNTAPGVDWITNYGAQGASQRRARTRRVRKSRRTTRRRQTRRS